MMSNAQKMLDRCLTDILTNAAWRDPEFIYNIDSEHISEEHVINWMSDAVSADRGSHGFSAAWSSDHEVGGKSLVKTVQFEFIVDYVVPQLHELAIAKDRTTKVEVRIPNHAVLDYTLGHATVSLRQIGGACRCPTSLFHHAGVDRERLAARP